MNLLITGLLPYDSGKTTLARSLIEELHERGVDVGFSKPITGMNGWYQYDCVVESIKARLLIGRDLFLLHKTAKSTDPIELEGPVVTLLLPPDPERLGWSANLYTSFNLPNQISVIRVSSIEKTRHYYVPANVGKTIPSLKTEIEGFLNTVKAEAIDAERSEELLLRSRAVADRCIDYLQSRHEFFIIESYSNIAAPTKKSLEVDAVAVVAPGKVALFKGEDYRMAVLALSDIKEPWKVTTEEIVSLLNPELVLDVKPGIKRGTLERVVDFLAK